MVVWLYEEDLQNNYLSLSSVKAGMVGSGNRTTEKLVNKENAGAIVNHVLSNEGESKIFIMSLTREL